MLGKLIRNILVNDSDVSALVGNNVFPMMAIEDIPYPYIVIERDGVEPEDDKDGPSCLDVIQYDLLIYSETNEQISDLGIKVRNALDRYSGTLEGLEVQSTRFLGDELEYADKDRVYMMGQRYSFRFIPIYGILPKATNLVATGVSTTQIDLTWTDNSTGETGFQVSRSTDCENWTIIATTAANATTYSDTGLSAGEAYIYKVRPTDGTNGSEWSNLDTGCTTSSGGATPSGIAYKRPILSGQTTSYRTGDDADNLANGVYDYTAPTYPVSYAEQDTGAADPFLNLLNNNAFGNTNRFTDINGLQVYGDDYVIDHLTGLGWYRITASGEDWNTAIDNAQSATDASFSDWRLPSKYELSSLEDFETVTGHTLNYSPFNITSTSYLWTSGTRTDSSANAWIIRFSIYNVTATAKTSTVRLRLMCRNHYT